MGSLLDSTVVMITGASSGIGRELARQLAPRAKTLILVARRRDRLEELRAELCAARPELGVHLEVRDLADTAALDAMLVSVGEAVGHVDVLINNAGVGNVGVFDLSDARKIESMITLNVTSLALLTRALLGPMVKKGRGGILNISSGFGLTFLPGFAAYIGTKHFVTGFTEALRADVSGTGVTVTQICPGPVATEFEQNVGNFTGHKVPTFLEISGERCARISLRAFERGRALVVPGLIMRAMMVMAALTPRFVLRIIANVVGRTLRKQQLALGAQQPH